MISMVEVGLKVESPVFFWKWLEGYWTPVLSQVDTRGQSR
jgi:hypothetical protein